ncbi:hypothetical protein, partial [Escherichia coli]
AYGPQNDVTLKMPAFEWVHVQLHQQKGMISLSPPTICNSALTAGITSCAISLSKPPVLTAQCTHLKHIAACHQDARSSSEMGGYIGNVNRNNFSERILGGEGQ